jgi:hypothetical protein
MSSRAGSHALLLSCCHAVLQSCCLAVLQSCSLLNLKFAIYQICIQDLKTCKTYNTCKTLQVVKLSFLQPQSHLYPHR